jgi:hypothetical protein
VVGVELFVNGPGHSSYLLAAARGRHHLSVLDGGPDTWATWTGETLVVGR